MLRFRVAKSQTQLSDRTELCIVDNKTLSAVSLAKCFLSTCVLSSNSLDTVFYRAEVLI